MAAPRKRHPRPCPKYPGRIETVPDMKHLYMAKSRWGRPPWLAYARCLNRPRRRARTRNRKIELVKPVAKRIEDEYEQEHEDEPKDELSPHPAALK